MIFSSRAVVVLAMVPAFGDCGGIDPNSYSPFRPLLPVANGTQLFYYDGRNIVSSDLNTGVRKWVKAVPDQTASFNRLSQFGTKFNL